MKKLKRDLTTGEAAKILMCSQQTVIRLFDSGGLQGGYKVPGSKNRRIPKEVLQQYAKKNKIPVNESFFGESKPADVCV